MKKLKTVFKFVTFFLSVVSLNIGLGFLNFDLNNEFLSYVSEKCESSQKKDFAYCTEITNFSDDLLIHSNDLNKQFYNNKNTLCIFNDSYTFNNQNIYFSNFSFLKDDASFTTNHVYFKNNLVDYNLFISNENSIILPNDFAETIASSNGISISELIGEEINFKAENLDAEFVIGGIWDDSIKYQSYYVYNSLYSNKEFPVIFSNNMNLIINGTKKVECTFSGNLKTNKEFLHYLTNFNGKELELKINESKINDWHIDDKSLIDSFLIIKEYANRKTIKIYGYVCLAFAAITAAAFLMLLFSNTSMNYYIETFAYFILYFLQLLIVKLISLQKNGGLHLFTFSRIGLYLSSGIAVIAVAYLLVNKIVWAGGKAETIENKSAEVRQNNLLLITFDSLNRRSAGSIRVCNFIDMVSKNYCITHLGYFDETEDAISENNLSFKGNYKNKFLNLFESRRRINLLLKNLFKNHTYRAIYVYSPLPISIYQLVKKYSIKFSTPIINDVTEFQSFSEWNILKPGWFHLSNVFTNFCLINHGDNVISITNYLSDFFSFKGAKTIVLPPVFNAEPLLRKTKSDAIRFSYIGNPGKKDDIKTCIKGFKLFISENKNKKIQINFYGSKSLEKILNKLNCDPNYFIYKGVAARNEIANIYTNTDFTFILRDSKARFAKAGFPSKVAESLNFSTPILTNISSDLGLYLKDNYNCVLVEKRDASSFASSLSKCFDLDASSLSKNAKTTFDSYFDLDVHSHKMLDFVEEVSKKDNGKLYQLDI